jgi:hypothetical protein
MDELTVAHRVNGEPQCDRCYWQGVAENEDPDYPVDYAEMEWEVKE